MTLGADLGHGISLGNPDESSLLVHCFFHVILRPITTMAIGTTDSLPVMDVVGKQ
jgi:hypothetical protein